MQKLNDPSAVIHYHDATKHHFHRFARSLGYLDWASQPKPFRSFEGAPVVRLPPDPAAADATPPPTIQGTRATYDRLFASSHESPQPLTRATLGEFLRYSLGLSAWKAFRDTRWSLRVNPSSGNLHPTEAYVICGAIDGLAASPAVWHYAADRHVLERRCSFDVAARGPGEAQPLVVALTSIHWREAWKYGERAFRYCQHDIGHAIAALGIAAALHGWRMELAADWPHADIAALAGCDRDEDFFEAEREDAGCLLLVDTAANGGAGGFEAIEQWTRSARSAVNGGVWTGRASQLSEDHVQWTIIDEVADATGKRQDTEHVRHSDHQPRASGRLLSSSSRLLNSPIDRHIDARTLILQRRSAVAFDGISRCSRGAFIDMLARTLPTSAAERSAAPWDVVPWPPRIHLVLFIHRVDEVAPGLYVLPRDGAAAERLRSSCRAGFAWEQASEKVPLYLLQTGEHRTIAKRLSCDQDIASDGFFSLGMLADFEETLNAFGPHGYRELFWECGAIGQLLYLEAEAAGARATGIGCFYDDPVHALLGLTGHSFQSLYHFTIGMPVEDNRLTTNPGYPWEVRL